MLLYNLPRDAIEKAINAEGFNFGGYAPRRVHGTDWRFRLKSPHSAAEDAFFPSGGCETSPAAEKGPRPAGLPGI
jgi:hypothetical protein